jgi:hypothetical protein
MFEYTVVLGHVVYPDVLKAAVEICVTDDGNESSKILIRQWAKDLCPSYRSQVDRIWQGYRGRSLIITNTGLLGWHL